MTNKKSINTRHSSPVENVRLRNAMHADAGAGGLHGGRFRCVALVRIVPLLLLNHVRPATLGVLIVTVGLDRCPPEGNQLRVSVEMTGGLPSTVFESSIQPADILCLRGHDTPNEKQRERPRTGSGGPD